MDYTLEDYENAVLLTLGSLTYLKTLKGYTGELDAQSALEQFRRGFPGVLVGVDGLSLGLEIMPYAEETVRVDLIVGDRSYRSQDEARGVGVYAMLADIRDLIFGKKLRLDIQPVLTFSADKLPLCTPTQVLYLVSFEIVNDKVTVAVEG